MAPSSAALAQWIDLEYMTLGQAALLLGALSLPIIFLAVRSLAGLGPVRRWVALGVRLALVLVLVLLLAGLQLRQKKKDVEVIVLADISDSTSLYRDFPGYPGIALSQAVNDYLRAASRLNRQPNDLVGLVSFNDQAMIDLISNEQFVVNARPTRDPGGTTDIASAINLGLAAFRNTTLRRLVLICDGNQTAGGDLKAAIASAAAQHVPIDVMMLRYEIENEVMVDRLTTGKSWRRENEPFTLDVFLKSTNLAPVTGTLTVFHAGDRRAMTNDVLARRQVTIEPATVRNGKIEPRLHVEHIAVPELKAAGVHEFKATFTDAKVTLGPAGGTARADSRADNNTGSTFVIVHGKGKVLLVDNIEQGRSKFLVDALTQRGITVETIRMMDLPQDLMRLQSYDAIVLGNVPLGHNGLTIDQDKMLASYVHELGGGLIMLGGPDSFGAGGWQGSKVEEVMPVSMDVPAQRQMPKGALVLCMHSCEMPQGNYWGEQCAIKAVEALSNQDEVGVVSYGWNAPGNKGVNGAQWDWPLQPKRSGSQVIAAIKRMQLGDAPSFDDFLQLALNGVTGQPGLAQCNAARKHVIVISDGDPQQPTQATLDAFVKAKVTVSTVPVYPHQGDARGIPPTMKLIADATGGTAYPAININPNQLPQIFIKEAMTVRRSMIQSDDSGIPVKRETVTDPVQGITAFPPVTGYVLSTKKNAPEVSMPLSVALRDDFGKTHIDPLLAHWQSGLGRAAAFTSDAHNRWANQWIPDALYAKFWVQLVRYVQRPAMSTDFDVQVTRTGDKAILTVEALRKESGFLNFLSIGGTISGPDGRQDVKLQQTGPGQYTAEFDTRAAGNYVVVLNYAGQKKEDAGWLMSGLSVMESPEMRNLKSDEQTLKAIADQTGGRILSPWDPATADLFSREGLLAESTPLPVRQYLLPLLIALLIVDVATRRIAWDWQAIKRGLVRAADYVRAWTLTKRVETAQTLDALKKKREEVAEARFKEAVVPPVPLPDASAKFEGQGVEGDIGKVVGGATDRPLPPPPRKIQPKGGAASAAGHTGSLLEAKRRAQQAIKQKEKGEG
jgi:uncharacterized membrane protein/Mg-chelatase subunit ChlD